ncbi:MAG: class I SAM-dependent methyltransferase [Ignavibacteriales bacterium]|nr:class I SAM-dependent methyltransferase [Ignavibacteriales bacterium]
MKSNNNFYNSASVYYDKMIDFDSALQKRKILLSNFIDDKIKSVADVGCGTGVDSISLSQLGLNVTAFDPSSEMINTARTNSEKHNCKIDFHIFGANEIPKTFYNKFDIVVSLGNTLANIPFGLIEKSVAKLFKLLKKDGKVLIQILNYEKILKEKERIVNITKKDDEYFIRFYDFCNKDLTFNILKFKADQTTQKELISTKIFPYTTKGLKQVFKEAGFKNIELFGGLDKKVFDAKISNDLILFAQK